MQSFSAVFDFKTLFDGMLFQGETRFLDIYTLGKIPMKQFLGVFLCHVIPFEDEELMVTAVALRGKFVDTIRFFAEGGGPKTLLAFEDIPDMYLRDFVPLVVSYHRLFTVWKEYDTTQDITLLVQDLSVALDNYKDADARGDAEEKHGWGCLITTVRERIVTLFSRVRGGFDEMDPCLLADLCMYMPDEMNRILPRRGL